MRRAFTIYEVVVWLALISIVMVFASEVFMQTTRAMQQHTLSEWEQSSRSSLLTHLRNDTWPASSCVVTGECDLLVTTASGQVRYRADDQAVTRAVAGKEGDTITWPVASVTFTRPAATLMLVHLGQRQVPLPLAIAKEAKP
jgi:hypothetical protein